MVLREALQCPPLEKALNSAVKFQKLNRRGRGPNCRLGMRLLLLKCVIAANNFPYALLSIHQLSVNHLRCPVTGGDVVFFHNFIDTQILYINTIVESTKIYRFESFYNCKE